MSKMKIAVIGLGLIGGSLAKTIRARTAHTIYGVDLNGEVVEEALRTGVLDAALTPKNLPECDVVILTASTLVNKTLPHLLEVCRNSYTILAGPSCPMCPALLELGLDRLAGLVITQPDAMKDKIRCDLSGPPYPLGKPFLLTK